ncbi:acyl-coenzyme A diphosphatase NUDT19 [Dipodomys merriami]|uniref:acyl-coenzyme A diphosphatase NUDT19 n=1 Tax=Dipodomys merriami TaxID=94247 RepID=UPI00385583DC
MSTAVPPGPSLWRRAATVILAAGWTRPAAAGSLPPPPAEDFRLLLLKRAANQGFLPNAHVFPGGVLDSADRSPDWLRLFAPHYEPPRFGLGLSARPRAAFLPGLPDFQPDAADPAALPDDLAERICAIRETFEEAGVLLLRPRRALPARGPGAAAPEPARALAPPAGLDAWRARVRSDPRQFLSLCAHLDCAPDIWALRDWSGWLTPPFPGARRRFNTAFFLCCLLEPPPADPDLSEVTECQWLSPSEATENFLSKNIWLACPQFYEIRRLANFTSFSALHKFCLDHALEGPETWMPITLETADSTIRLFPGDELYIEDSYFVDNCMSTDKTTEEIMKEGKKFHRVVMHSNYLYSLHVTIQPKSKHIYPKIYIVNKSRL